MKTHKEVSRKGVYITNYNLFFGKLRSREESSLMKGLGWGRRYIELGECGEWSPCEVESNLCE